MKYNFNFNKYFKIFNIVSIFFVKSFALVELDLIIVPLMCVMCVALPFVLVTIAPRFISAAEVNLFFLLETIIGPIWVWLFINEVPPTSVFIGGLVIILSGITIPLGPKNSNGLFKFLHLHNLKTSLFQTSFITATVSICPNK